jgi:hypothetical protein
MKILPRISVTGITKVGVYVVCSSVVEGCSVETKIIVISSKIGVDLKAHCHVLGGGGDGYLTADYQAPLQLKLNRIKSARVFTRAKAAKPPF